MMNLRRIDVHMHTLFSDGKLTVEELIQRCKEMKIATMAITDHDTVNGVISMKSFETEGITVIPGIELSAYSEEGSQIHVTGYFPKNTSFASLQNEIGKHATEVRIQRCKSILAKLDKDGYHIPYSDIEAKLNGKNPSLPIIAECLHEHKYTSYIREAYEKFIGDGQPYYEPVKLYTLKETIDLVHRYHGVAAIAHPWLYKNSLSVCEKALEYGVDGVECFPPKHYEEYGTQKYAQFAHEHDLFCSSGSDFHGITKDEVPIGSNIFPEEEADRFICMLKKHNVL